MIEHVHPPVDYGVQNAPQEVKDARPEQGKEQEKPEMHTLKNLDETIVADWLRTRLGKQSNIAVRPFKDTDAYGADPNRSFRYAELGDRYGSSASEDDDEIQPNQVALLKRMDVYDPGLPERLVLVHGDKTMTVIVHKQTPGKLDLRVLVGQVDTQGVFSSRVVSVNTGNEQASADATAELVAKAKEMIEEVIKSVVRPKSNSIICTRVLGCCSNFIGFEQRKRAQRNVGPKSLYS